MKAACAKTSPFPKIFPSRRIGARPRLRRINVRLTLRRFADEFARMISSARCFAVLVFTGLLLFRAGAADWPQWRGPLRTGHVPAGVPVPASLPVEPKVLWRVKAGEGFASPVVAAGKVFLFDNQEGKETLRALRVDDGHELWRAVIDDTFKDGISPPGTRGTPLVDGARVYAQSCKGELHCLDVADGKKIWGVNFTKDFGAVFIGEKGQAPGATRHGNTGQPIIDGDLMFVSVGSTNGAGMVCFDKATGRVVWKAQNEIAAYAAPMIATVAGRKQIVNFMADAVLGLDRETGQLLWRFPVKTAFARHVTTPVILDDMVVVSSHQVGLMGLKVSRVGEKFKVEQAWLSKEGAMNFSSPVAVGDALYGLGPAKNIVCIDMPTGKTLWSKDGWITTSADKAHASFIVMGKNILMLTDGGLLVLFGADPGVCREVSRAQICGANWCNPAYLDGTLFVREGLKTTGELLRVALRP